MKLNKLVLLSAALTCGLSLASCGNNGDSASAATSNNDSNTQSAAESVDNSTPATAAKFNVGVGYDVAYSAKTGYAQYDIAAAMVAFDSTTGKVTEARLDVVQVKVEANEAKDGIALTSACKTREDGKVKTKLELGKDYGMLKDGVVAEVDNQIEAYAAWTVGKTVEEISAAIGPKSEGGNPNYATDPELLASCTISINQFVAAFAKAYENKGTAEFDSVDGLKAGVAINAGVAYNYGNPSKEVSADIAGTIVGTDGKVVAASIDAVVISNSINAEDGAITVDTTTKYHKGSDETTTKYLSKKSLGDAYAMANAETGITEWYVQAAAIEAAAQGKTAAEIAVLVKDNKESEDKTNMIVGATITVSSYVEALKRATEYAPLEHVGPQHEAA